MNCAPVVPFSLPHLQSFALPSLSQSSSFPSSSLSLSLSLCLCLLRSALQSFNSSRPSIHRFSSISDLFVTFTVFIPISFSHYMYSIATLNYCCYHRNGQKLLRNAISVDFIRCKVLHVHRI